MIKGVQRFHLPKLRRTLGDSRGRFPKSGHYDVTKRVIFDQGRRVRQAESELSPECLDVFLVKFDHPGKTRMRTGVGYRWQQEGQVTRETYSESAGSAACINAANETRNSGTKLCGRLLKTSNRAGKTLTEAPQLWRGGGGSCCEE